MAFSRVALKRYALVGPPAGKGPGAPPVRRAVRFKPGVATSNVAFNGPTFAKPESLGYAPLVSKRLRIGPNLPDKW